MLILGHDLVAFLRARRAKNKRTCKPGKIYCVRCRTPRAPAGDMADYQPLTATLGNLIGICSECEAMIYRRVSLAKLEQVRAKLDITMPQALPHIGEYEAVIGWAPLPMLVAGGDEISITKSYFAAAACPEIA